MNNKYKVLITGASGFIGGSLISRLSCEQQFLPIAGVRKKAICKKVESRILGDFHDLKGLRIECLEDIQVIIHAAAFVHFPKNEMKDSQLKYQKINVEATLHLASQAAVSGVKRFIFISTIGVNGDVSYIPFSEEDEPAPVGVYAQSKFEAEQGLIQIAKNSDMDVVIIRPPMVYGLNAPGSFGKLLRVVQKGVLLPLGAVNNRRSFVGIDNLVDFIVTCIDHPAAANQIFVVADGVDLSTTDLLQKIARAMQQPSRLIPVPSYLLSWGARLLGKRVVAQSLLESLRVDISKARNLLGWEPPVSVDEGLRRCVDETHIQNGVAWYSLLRFFDIFFSAFGLIICLPIFAVIMVLGWFDTGSPLFFQQRVGCQLKPFVLVKFRTMKLDTASVASHLVPSSSITKLGSFLRRTKLDELPQLWNILKGEMSLVGPRPCLFNQEELMRERDERGVFTVRPGITGLAQVNEIDMSTPKLLAEIDAKMIHEMSVRNYFIFIFQTAKGKGSGDRVKK
ncbi:sugar transferase [Desulfuromonas acetoxidans]|uniref:sugar transferase n=1 Tax=Desulfuromonas acetoxidans TaxID=891 RepID=UPI002931ECDE|nr:sugar transferase [Desulfuromonas acetoxidans]